MKRLMQMVLILVLIQTLLIVTLNARNAFSANPNEVDKKGLTVKAESEYVISGYLSPLNGKYKLRSTETVIEPGGYLGEHRHTGPGIRFIKSGAITSVHPGKTVVYEAGEQFYESGSAMHALQNKTNTPVQIRTYARVI